MSWTHLGHGPDGNPVSRYTRVGPSAYVQWVIGPNWPRHHDSGGSSELHRHYWTYARKPE